MFLLFSGNKGGQQAAAHAFFLKDAVQAVLNPCCQLNWDSLRRV